MDVERLRALFPVLERQLYLNHAGVAPTSTRVAAAIASWVDDLVQNGVRNERAWEARSEAVRIAAARTIGATREEIAFVRNTSHGLGLIAEGLPWSPRDEVAVCTELEYPSNVYPWLHLGDRGVVVKPIAARSGGVVAEEVEAAIGPRTKVVAVSSVQYATGHRTDLEAVSAVCKRHGCLFVVDGIQSVGAEPIDVRRAGIDVLSADSHKWMLGLPGIGFLFVSSAVVDRIRPVLVGWKSTTDAWNFDRAHFELRRDASKLEEGSPAYTGIYGMGAALDLLLEIGLERVRETIAARIDQLDRGLRAIGCTVGPAAGDRAGILTFLPPDGDAAALHRRLSQANVSLSLRRGRLRASPHVTTTGDDIERFLRLVGG